MNNSFKYKVVQYYCIIFYVLMIYKWLNGFFLYQLQPSFFYTRQDLTTWLLMQTGLHQWLLNNPAGWLLFDILFYSMPLLLFYANKKKQFELPVAVIMFIVNWCYAQCYTLYPSLSIEGFLGWMFFPVLFMTNNEKSFLFLYEAIRYFFLFFFVSAGVWKFAQHGIFHLNEMSGILLYQHNQLLTNSPGYWQTDFIFYLVQHQTIAYLFYLSAAILELSFIIGFFTKKYDKLIFLLFALFLIMDYLVMRIPYFEIAALALPLIIKKK